MVSHRHRRVTFTGNSRKLESSFKFVEVTECYRMRNPGKKALKSADMKHLKVLSLVLVGAATIAIGAQSRGGAAKRAPAKQVRKFTVVEATIPEMQAAMKAGRLTSRELVVEYLARIATYEDRLNAVIAVNPNAIKEAEQLDRERAQGKLRGPLHGIPIALKNNIHTTEMPTTGGALAFTESHSTIRSHADKESKGCRRHHHRQDRTFRTRQLGGGRSHTDAGEL